jgi:hypothetical protein
MTRQNWTAQNTYPEMRYLVNTLFLLLTNFTTAFAQQANVTDSVYNIRDSVLIPTRSGIALSAIIVRKKMNTTPLLVVLITRVQVTPYFEKRQRTG